MATNEKANTATGATVGCWNCEHTNDASRKFCAHCGTGLWLDCPKCEQPFSRDEAFCGSCGFNLREHTEQIQQKAAADLEVARQQLAEMNFDEAGLCAKRLAALKDPRLRSYQTQAATLLETVQQDSDGAGQKVQTALDRGKELMEQFQYGKAKEALSTIPAALQDKEFRELLQRATSRHEEFAQLKADVRKRLSTPEATSLLPSIERLLELKPDYEDARRIGESLRDKLCSQTVKLLKKFEYEQAFSTIEGVTTTFENDTTRRLTLHAKERAWMWRALRTSTIVDETLVQIAGKILAKDPGNQKVSKLLESMKTRRAGAKGLRPAAWAPARDTSDLGFPLDTLYGTGNVSFDASCVGVLKQHPVSLNVAIGLALQAAGLSKLKTDLAPRKKSKLGFLGIGGKSKSDIAWGIDASGSTLKAVQISAGADGAVQVTKCFVQPLDRQNRAVAIQALAGQIGDNKAPVCISHAGSQTLLRVVKLPPTAPKKLQELIKFEVTQQFPLPESELASSHQILNEEEINANQGVSPQILFLASRKTHLDETLAAFELNNMKVDMVQSDALALYNFAAHLRNGQTGVTGWLDIGQRDTSLVFHGGEKPWVRTFGAGGDDFTRAIAQRCNLTLAEAEQVKRQPWKAPQMSALAEAVAAVTRRVSGELQRSVDSLGKELPGVQVEKLFCSGGGSQMYGLVRGLQAGQELDWENDED